MTRAISCDNLGIDRPKAGTPFYADHGAEAAQTIFPPTPTYTPSKQLHRRKGRNVSKSTLTLIALTGSLAVLLGIQTHRLQRVGPVNTASPTETTSLWDGSGQPTEEAIQQARAVLDRAREDRPFLDAEDEATAAQLAEAIAVMLDDYSPSSGTVEVFSSKRAAAKNRRKLKLASKKRASAKAEDADADDADSPRNPVRAKKLAASAKRMIQQGAYEEAAQALRESIEADPQSAKSYRSLADLYRKMGLVEDEAQVYQDWMAGRPDDALPHYFMANAMLRAGADADVLAELSQFQSLSGETLSSYPMAASVYRKLGMHAEEGLLLQDWVNEAPNSTDARRTLAQHYRQVGNLEASLAEYQVVADLLPENVGSHSNLAAAYQRLNLYAEAQQEYHEALNLRPNSTALRNNLANSYRRGGDLYAAVEMYQSVVEMAPGSADARRAAGQMRRIENQLSKPKDAEA